MKTLRFVLAALAVCALCLPLAAQCSQSLPNNLLNVEGTSSTSFPWNTAGASHKWQWVYDTAQFSSQSPITITQIYVRADLNGPVNAFNFPSMQVTLASSPNNYVVGTPPAGQDTTFANNLAADATIVRAAAPWVAGPFPANPAGPAPWIPLGLTAPFTYNPALGMDLVVQLEVCGTTTTWGRALDGQTGAHGAVGGNRYGNTAAGGCTAAVRNFNNDEFVPIIKIDYNPAGGGGFQVNQPQASLDANGSTNTACTSNTVNVCSGNPVTLNFNSTNVGSPWDLGVTFNAGLSPSLVVTPNGQRVDINLLHPSFLFLFGGTFTVPFAPLSIPFTPPPLTSIEAQMIVLGPPHPDGFALSSALQLNISSGTFPVSVPGPNADDSAVSINVGGGGLCICNNFVLYGTSYTTLHIISNGRVMAGAAADTDFSPTQAEALADNPFIGAWNDLNPAAGGTITLNSAAPGSFTVNYNAVAYFATTPVVPITFSIGYDCTTRAWTLGGLAGIAAHPTAASMFLGISRGITGATDNGPTAFALGGPNAPANPTSMIYAFGAGGTLTPGINSIVFTPSTTQAPNYDWSAF